MLFYQLKGGSKAKMYKNLDLNLIFFFTHFTDFETFSKKTDQYLYFRPKIVINIFINIFSTLENFSRSKF